MEQESRRIVSIRPGAALATHSRLLAALEDAFPVHFRADEPGAAALVFASGDDPGTADPDVPTFIVRDDAGNAPPQDAYLLDDSAVDRRVRGIVLADRPAGPALVTEATDVLAVLGSEPVWTRSRAPVPVHRLRTALSELGTSDVLYSRLSNQPVGIVALIHFLREVTAGLGWETPVPRASIVFDDPNLRWSSYGFIDYRRLVDHADEHDYHASMAMIPLDAQRPHGPTASLFERRGDRLSLVFHGNDHAKHELLTPRPAAAALAMAAQAVRRIERFEQRSGLQVDRVMMPPHGLASEEFARGLGAVGFDALCGIHPLPWTAEWPSTPLLAGWRPAEYIAGCAVVARFPLCYDESDVALRALLDHPIVLYGHHDDLAEGLAPLEVASGRVNRLGAVRWSRVGDAVLSNFAVRLAGDRATIRPYARRIRVVPPAAAITVEAPSATYGDLELAGWSIGSESAVRPFGSDATLDSDAAIEIRLRGEHDVDPRDIAAPTWRPWPQLRRTATEVRDRALPLRPTRVG